MFNNKYNVDSFIAAMRLATSFTFYLVSNTVLREKLKGTSVFVQKKLHNHTKIVSPHMLQSQIGNWDTK